MHFDYLISGSFAYDTILNHNGHFHQRILPNSIEKLNVAFGISDVNESFGGTGGNIAYNASILGSKPLLIGSLGNDFRDYIEHLNSKNVHVHSLTLHADECTAHAWLLTDANNNQITAFSAGAMKKTPIVPEVTPQLWHLAPDAHETTALLAVSAIKENKDYFLDPGQALPGFLEGSANEIIDFKTMLKKAKGIFLNEYEAELLVTKYGLPLSHWLSDENQFIVKTLGAEGSLLITKKYELLVSVAPCDAVVDPTGCGDAFRAGFIYGHVNQLELKDCLRLGSAMGSFAIEQMGGQCHCPTLKQVKLRALEVSASRVELFPIEQMRIA